MHRASLFLVTTLHPGHRLRYGARLPGTSLHVLTYFRGGETFSLFPQTMILISVYSGTLNLDYPLIFISVIAVSQNLLDFFSSRSCLFLSPSMFSFLFLSFLQPHEHSTVPSTHAILPPAGPRCLTTLNLAKRNTSHQSTSLHLTRVSDRHSSTIPLSSSRSACLGSASLALHIRDQWGRLPS